MTTLEDHIEYATECYGERAAWLGLMDRMQEVYDWPRSRAVRTAVTIRRLLRQHRERCAAEQLLQVEHDFRAFAQARAGEAAAPGWDRRVQLIPVCRMIRPMCDEHIDPEVFFGHGHVWVTVSHRWVLRMFREFLRDHAPRFAPN